MKHTPPYPVSGSPTMFVAQPKVDNVHFEPVPHAVEQCHTLPGPLEVARRNLDWHSLLHCTECKQTWYLEVAGNYEVHWKRVMWWNFKMRKSAEEMAIRARGIQRRGIDNLTFEVRPMWR